MVDDAKYTKFSNRSSVPGQHIVRALTKDGYCSPLWSAS